MRKTLLSALLLALSNLSFAIEPIKEYQCSSEETNKKITITANSNIYDDNEDDYFLIWTSGLFPEFVGFDQDIHECLTYDKDIQEGIHCKSISLAAGHDYRSNFIIKMASDLNHNPNSFNAQIIEEDGSIYNLECK